MQIIDKIDTLSFTLCVKRCVYHPVEHLNTHIIIKPTATRHTPRVGLLPRLGHILGQGQICHQEMMLLLDFKRPRIGKYCPAPVTRGGNNHRWTRKMAFCSVSRGTLSPRPRRSTLLCHEGARTQ